MDIPLRSDCTAGQIYGEVVCWTTSGNIRLSPLARVMGVGKQQHGMDEDIDGMAADFVMRLKEVTLAALDRTMREVKRLSQSVPKVNGRQICSEVGHWSIISLVVLLSLVSMLDPSHVQPPYIAISLNCQCGVVVCDILFVVMRHGMLAHCNTVPFVISSLFVI